MSEKKAMKIYLAGPMRGYEELNFPAFNKAAKYLRDEGHHVFNPAENDRPLDDLRGNFADDMEFICKEADAIAMMPGWRNSKGAIAENATARALGLKILHLFIWDGEYQLAGPDYSQGMK